MSPLSFLRGVVKIYLCNRLFSLKSDLNYENSFISDILVGKDTRYFLLDFYKAVELWTRFSFYVSMGSYTQS